MSDTYLQTVQQLVRLNNGTTVSRAFLDVVMQELQAMTHRPMMLKMLMDACNYNRGKIPNHMRRLFKSWLFIPSTGILHPSVQNILLCAVRVENSGIQLNYPEAEEEAAAA